MLRSLYLVCYETGLRLPGPQGARECGETICKTADEALGIAYELIRDGMRNVHIQRFAMADTPYPTHASIQTAELARRPRIIRRSNGR